MIKTVDETTPYYICSDGRKLEHQRTETRNSSGFKRTFEVYACSDCSGCSLKSECLYDKFRRFNYRSSEKVYIEFMLYVFGRNINKYHRFKHGKIKKFEGETEQTVA